MNRAVLIGGVILVWVIAYADWLQDGWLKFGLPASWNDPFTVAITYDLEAQAKRSLRQAAVRAVEDKTPDWIEFWNWFENEGDRNDDD